MRRFQYRLILFLTMMSGALYMSAQTWEYPTDAMLSGSSLVVGDTCNQHDPIFGNSYITSTNLVRNTIILEIDPTDTCILPDSFSIQMVVTVVWTDSSGTVSTDIKTLNVHYNNRLYTKDTLQSYYSFFGGHIVNVTITSVTVNGISDTLPDCIKLVNQMIVSRNYTPFCRDSVINVDTMYQPGEGELTVSWEDIFTGGQVLTGDEYDLEWTFYDDSSALMKDFIYHSTLPYTDAAFFNNATRVSVNGTQYNIPLLYDSGYLMFRIRPVRLLPNDIRVPGLWTTDAGLARGALGIFIYHVNGHEPKLNWQAKTSFAEEGKRKSVVSYYDGASKNRQTVTKINSDNIAVVAETIYDWEGRPVLNTLPAPTIESMIKHFKKFNTNMGDTSYSWHDLDSTSDCNPSPRIMNPDSGSSRYYSANNPLRNSGFNQYIPDAFGYPFSETQYTNDLTNRVRRSSGPGKDHKMGTSHVTTYYYGAPGQSELNRLFGPEVGVQTHYFKNLVVDANGQVSVTYQDMHGRTIATALAGFPSDSPSHLDRIPDYRSDTILYDAILDTTNNFIDGTSITCTKTILAATAGTYNFYYTLFPEQFKYGLCDSTQFCFQCIYDLTITVTDDCNNSHLPGGQPYVRVDSNYSFSGVLPYYFDTLCGDTVPPIIDSFSLSLPIGEYTVTKTLSINQHAIDFYYAYFLRSDTCLKTFNDFYKDALSQIDTSSCNVTCATCLQRLGTPDSFCIHYLASLLSDDSLRILTDLDTLNARAAYASLKSSCDLMCDSFSICEQKFDLMLQDMSPTGGQYATYLTDSATGNIISGGNDTTSIFYVDSPSAYSIYHDTLGTHDPLYSDPSIVYYNSINQPDTVIADLNNDGILDTVVPNKLSLKQFIQFWKPSWAYALVKYHPEYCYYEFCVANSASNEYDEWLRKISSYDTALAYGLMNPLNMPFDTSGFGPNTSHRDPFFDSTAIGYPYLRNFEGQSMIHYWDTISIWQMATFTVACRDSSANPYTCLSCQKNYYWNSFRNMYLGKKRMLQDSVMQIWADSSCSHKVPKFGPGGWPHYTNKTARFEIINGQSFGISPYNPGDSTSILARVDSMGNSGVEFSCASYSQFWWNKLSGCHLSPYDSLVIISELIAVCDSGTDRGHPYGASSTRPGIMTPHGNTTFEGVLIWADSILSDWNYHPSDSCTSFLITNPLPNSSTPMYYQTALINKPNACSCGKINAANNQYLASGFSGTLSEYVNQTQNIVITNEDINILIKACDSGGCEVLPHPVTLPIQFDCDVICVNCYQVIHAYTQFLQRFPNVYQSNQYLTLMQSYMNSALGMNLTAIEYFNFMHDSCHYTSFPTKDTVPCLPPIARNDTFFIGYQQSGLLNVTGNDQTNGYAYLNIIQHATYGKDSVWSGEILYYPDSASRGHTAILRYSICNTCDSISCDTATVYINISNTVKRYLPPTVRNDTLTVCADSIFSINPITNDSDSDGSSLSLTDAIIIGGTSGEDSIWISGNIVHAHIHSYGPQYIVYNVCNNDPRPLCGYGLIVGNVLNCDTGGHPGAFRSMMSLGPSPGPGPDTVPLANTYSLDTPSVSFGFSAEMKYWKDKLKQFIEKLRVSNQDTVHSNNIQLPPTHFPIDILGILSVPHGHTVHSNNIQLPSIHFPIDIRGMLTVPHGHTVHSNNIQLPSIHFPIDIRGMLTAPYVYPIHSNNIHLPNMHIHMGHPDILNRHNNNILQTGIFSIGRHINIFQLDTFGPHLHRDVNQRPLWHILQGDTQQYARASFIASHPDLNFSQSHQTGTNPLQDMRNLTNRFLSNNNASQTTQFQSSNMMMNRGGYFMPMFLPSLPTWCDSLMAARDTFAVDSGSDNSGYSFQNAMNTLLDRSYSISEWIAQLDSCNLSCPAIIKCHLADSLMNVFDAMYPPYDSSAPPFLWSNFLDAHNAGIDSAGHVWYYSSQDWTALLSCCPITPPVAGNMSIYCDTLNAILARITGGGTNFDPNDLVTAFNNSFGVSHYDSVSQTMVQNDLNYWFGQMLLCGDSCKQIINCDSINAVLSQLDSFRTSGSGSPYSLPITVNYLRFKFPNYSGLSSASLAIILQCCGSGYVNFTDTVLSQCDSTLFLAMELQFDYHGDSCLPTWAYNHLLIGTWDSTISEYCVQAAACDLKCVSYCNPTLTTHCDSINSVYHTYRLILGNTGATISDSLGVLQELFSALFGDSVSGDVLIGQILACDTSGCAVADSTLSHMGPLFSSYSPCIPALVFEDVMNNRSGENLTDSQWCALLNRCGDTCPTVCSSGVYTTCDSVTMAITLYGKVLATYYVPDSNALISEIFSMIFGRTITTSQAYVMMIECTNPCDSMYHTLQALDSVLESYYPCVPSYVVTSGLTLIAGGETQVNAEGVMELLTHCGFTTPDTCLSGLGTTSCDTLLAIYGMYRHAIDVGVGGSDTMSMLVNMVHVLLDTNFTYDSIMARVRSCNIPSTCDSVFMAYQTYLDSMAVYDSPDSNALLANIFSATFGRTINYSEAYVMVVECTNSCDSIQGLQIIDSIFYSYTPCVPSYVLSSLITFVSGGQMRIGADGVIELFAHCGYIVPDTCLSGIGTTSCDTLMAIYGIYRHVIDNGFSGGDTMSMLVNMVQLLLNDSLSYDSIMTHVMACNIPSTCDSVLMAYQIYLDSMAVYDSPDSNALLANIFSAIFGRTINYSGAFVMMVECSSPCDSMQGMQTVDSIFYSYTPCVPSYVVSSLVAFVSGGQVRVGADGVIELLAHCGYIVPDTCLSSIGTTSCDTLMAIYGMYRHMIDAGAGGGDTMAMLVNMVQVLLNDSLPYDSIMTRVMACNIPSTCDSVLMAYQIYLDSMAVYDSPDSNALIASIFSATFGRTITTSGANVMVIKCFMPCDSLTQTMQALDSIFNSYHPCVPAYVVSSAFTFATGGGLYLNAEGVIELFAHCGYTVPDTCLSGIGTTSCDTLMAVYGIYRHVIDDGFSGEDTMSMLVGMVQMTMNIGLPYDSIMVRVAACNTTTCDSVHIAFTLFLDSLAWYGSPEGLIEHPGPIDTNALLAAVFTNEFGRPISAGDAWTMLLECSPCTEVSPTLTFVDEVIALYYYGAPCIPAYAVGELCHFYTGIPLSAQDLCTLSMRCGLPCLDTCVSQIAPDLCDSLKAAYQLYRHLCIFRPCDTLFLKYLVRDMVHLDVTYDSIMTLLIDCRTTCDTVLTAYQTYLDSMALYDSPDSNALISRIFSAAFGRTITTSEAYVMGLECTIPCDSMSQSLQIIDSVFASYHPCVPSYVVSSGFTLITGITQVNAGGMMEILTHCGFAAPDTCLSGIGTTSCDTLMAVYGIYRHVIADGLAGSDTMSMLVNFVQVLLNITLPYDSIMTRVSACDTSNIVHCDQADTVMEQIQIFLSVNPGILYTDQPDFNTAMYHYLDSIFHHGIYVHTDWCAVLTGCGDSCPRVISGPMLCNRPLLPPVTSNYNDSCRMIAEAYAYDQASGAYTAYLQNLYSDFVTAYVEKCLGAYRLENFHYAYPNGEYHYTLYYYDQAGNLVKTIPPAGVDLDSQHHRLPTRYRYNTLNQVVEQMTPDAGRSLYWYDLISKLTFSQNAKQQPFNQLSYTNYDALQRIVEVGQANVGLPYSYGLLDTVAIHNNWYPSLANGSVPAVQVTHTYYDYDTLHISDTLGIDMTQYLRNRISSTTYADILDTLNIHHYQSASHYRYDVHGNVSTLVQEDNRLRGIGQSYKRLDYDFDLISGKVNTVMYQQGKRDMFIHSYTYDADNRITDVLTSHDSILWAHDAGYSYYHHGPLARMVLGGYEVQGLDYAYTIQGWLKGVNGDSLGTSVDMGHDGAATGMNHVVSRDQLGFTLGYYTGDYQPIAWGTGGTLSAANTIEAAYSNIGIRDLFNGNISHMAVNIGQLDTPMEYRYHYDQLNRLTAMDAFMGLTTSSGAINWSISTPMPDYAERIQYDPNGNISTYLRHGTTAGGQPIAMDSLSYKYKPGTNQLDHVNDGVPAGNYSVDIDDQDTLNYTYDQIGNLTRDSSEHIDSIYWTVYGKIWQINKHNGDTIKFAYDPSGNRIMKAVYRDTTHRWKNTYYVHDATGNIMATYQWINMDSFRLDDVPIYGSSRLGSWSPDMLLSFVDSTDSLHSVSVTNGVGYWAGGYKVYELNNHLGNVLSTISDRKLRVSVGGILDHYVAEVMTATDYYPFGMPMPFRQYGASYRFGFNGKEQDNEVEGKGNILDFGARIYDSRLGRWLAEDPERAKYVPISPYAFAANKPIVYIDKNGNTIFEAGSGKEVIIKFNSETGAIDAVSNASPALEKIIRETYKSSPTGKAAIEKLNSPDVKALIQINQKRVIWKNAKGKFQEAKSLGYGGQATKEDQGEKTNYKNIFVLQLNGVGSGTEAISKDKVDEYKYEDTRGKEIKKFTPEQKDQAVQQSIDKEGQATHDADQESRKNINATDLDIYEKKIPQAENGNRDLTNQNNIIYETNNASGQASSGSVEGETAGKKAVVQSYKETQPK